MKALWSSFVGIKPATSDLMVAGVHDTDCKYLDLSAGRSAFIGVGFGDRGDAFDFNVALQDHFK